MCLSGRVSASEGGSSWTYGVCVCVCVCGLVGGGTDRDMSTENPAYQGTDVDMLRNGS